MKTFNLSYSRLCLQVVLLLSVLAHTACLSAFRTEEVRKVSAYDNVIPKPVFTQLDEGDAFKLTPEMLIYVESGSDEVLSIGRFLMNCLSPAVEGSLKVLPANVEAEKGHITLTTAGANSGLGDEGYELTITQDGVELKAFRPAGLFMGVQTIRQLLPPANEGELNVSGLWEIPVGKIRDYPRFKWRGAMLDVSRHFFGVEDVKRYIDLMACYKLNRLHLHLSDDQGWRIMINSWPNLAEHGGSTKITGGEGGYYTQEEYAEIVAWAQNRYITIVPEIDMPGHTNAALASYPELNCDGIAPPLYTGMKVGFSSLCIDKEITYKFIDDVIGEIAALTPGPWFHVGGDEAHVTPKEDYIHFMNQVQDIVKKHGKQMIGWEEITQIELDSTSVAQHWHSQHAKTAAEQGVKVIVSPASRIYLDMKYNKSTILGLDWAGYNSVEDAYSWDPATQVVGVSESDVLGVEGPLWTETIETMADIEFMAFPRLIGIAEIGWSPAYGRNWVEYRKRLGSHGPRLDAMKVSFYRSELVPWK